MHVVTQYNASSSIIMLGKKEQEFGSGSLNGLEHLSYDETVSEFHMYSSSSRQRGEEGKFVSMRKKNFHTVSFQQPIIILERK